ncbi:RNA polymerase-binding transcription factor DksA [Alphaproteobacteria bacterium]|nr:RNA polymerase-binding transcription factor DksA [Alphaproteobacteria bacterium]
METKICDLPEGYVPSADEEFMNDFQREYFRRKLIQWKQELIRENEVVVRHLQEEGKTCTDSVDRATTEADLAYEIRTKERARKLTSKIDEALARIKSGSYGYCEETGEPISLKRLEARPIAVLSIEAQERHEKQERIQKDD